ncbi:MAG TPA: MFS transporter [Chloroflexota bacterium]|nr:MFS transporter [Chloroflexota bacterium]
MIDRVRRRLAGNRILMWVCVVIAVNQLGFGIIVPITPIYASTFGVSEAAIGLVVAVYGLGRFLFSVPVGQATDRFGRRRTIFAGTLVTCAGSLLCGLAGDFTQLLIFRFISGVGATTVITGTQIVVADVATRENRGRMMSTYQGFFSFAVGVGPSIGGLVALYAGPRAPFFVFAVLTLVAGTVALTQLPETRPVRGTAVSTDPLASPRGPSTVRLLLGNVGFLTVSVVTFVAAFNRTGALFSVVPLMGVDRLHLDSAAIGFAITLGNLCNLVFVTMAGFLVDRYGRKPVIVPSCLISCAAFSGFALAAGYPAFALSAVLWGAGSALANSASAAYAADQAPPGGNGTTMGIYRMLSDAGYVIGPALLGVVADGAGSDAALWLSAAIALGAAVPFALLAPETGRVRRVQTA